MIFLIKQNNRINNEITLEIRFNPIRTSMIDMNEWRLYVSLPFVGNTLFIN